MEGIRGLARPDIITAERSDVGRVRSENEDSCAQFAHASGYHLLVVADGMGGHRAGAMASRTAIEAVSDVFARFGEEPAEMLTKAIGAANRRVYKLAQDDPELRGMGTTVVALLIGPGEHGWVAHVGDSRAYRHRDGRMEPLTLDHSVVAEMLRRGVIDEDEAANHPRRNEILRCIGVYESVESDVRRIDLRPDDRYLLCSDGLTGMVDEAIIADVLANQDPEDAARALVQLANDGGGNDNVTVQLAWMKSCTATDEPAVDPLAETFDRPSADLAALRAAAAEAPPVDPMAETFDRPSAEIAALRAAAAASASTPTPTPVAAEEKTSRGLQPLLVVSAVLLAGLAALTLLWRVYSMNQDADAAAAPPASAEQTAR